MCLSRPGTVESGRGGTASCGSSTPAKGPLLDSRFGSRPVWYVSLEHQLVLDVPRPTEGIIVQEVQVTATITDRHGNPIPLDQFGFVPAISSGQRFWEAWPVAAGTQEPTTIPRDHDSYNYVMNRGRGRNSTRGNIAIVATARWHPQPMPALFTPNNPAAPWAGAVPATIVSPVPVLVPGTRPQPHNISVFWNCCPVQTARQRPRGTDIVSRTPDSAQAP